MPGTDGPAKGALIQIVASMLDPTTGLWASAHCWAIQIEGE